MANRRLNRIKGQTEDFYEQKEKYLQSKYGIPTLCSNNCYPIPQMPYNQPDPSHHDEAREFFANLRKTCRNNGSDEK